MASPAVGELFRRYVESAPVAWAVPRAQEALLLGRLALPPPVLDVGCGDGLFAQLAGTLDGAIGLDRGRRAARRAAARRVYRAVIRADAEALPFAAGSFGSVVSISTLEHVARLDRVLAEAARVLRPGGRLACSVPGPEFAASLFWPRLLRGVRWERAGRAYARAVDRLFQHVNLFPVPEWRARLARHGFVVRAVYAFNTPEAGIVQDLGYPTSALAAAARAVTGRFILWPAWRRLAARALTALVAPRLGTGDGAGTCYCFYAEAGPSGRV